MRGSLNSIDNSVAAATNVSSLEMQAGVCCAINAKCSIYAPQLRIRQSAVRIYVVVKALQVHLVVRNTWLNFTLDILNDQVSLDACLWPLRKSSGNDDFESFRVQHEGTTRLRTPRRVRMKITVSNKYLCAIWRLSKDRHFYSKVPGFTFDVGA